MPIFRHDDIEFHYQDSGSGGRPFVFQHGLGGDVNQPFGLFAQSTKIPSQGPLTTLRNLQHLVSAFGNGVRAGVVNA